MHFGQAITAGLETVAQSQPTYDWGNVLGPLVSGAIMGFVVYKSAQSMKIDRGKCRGLGITVGVTTAVGQLASSWFRGWAAKAGVAT